MKIQMEDLNPFIEDWQLFGFISEPEPGFDYSWIQVQENLSFIGYKMVISDCKLFYSARRPHIFLVVTPSKWNELWNISELAFSKLSSNGSILMAVTNERCIHISNVTSSFIEILVKTSKLPEEDLNLSTISCLQNLRLSGKIIKKPEKIPDEATPIETKEETNSTPIVTITGSSFSTNIQGSLNFSENYEISVTDNEATQIWNISFDDIANVESTKIGRIFVVLYTTDDKRYEIEFNESSSVEANNFVQKLRKIIESRS